MPFCSYCGTACDPGVSICPSCGNRIEDAPSYQPAQPTPTYQPPAVSQPPSRPTYEAPGRAAGPTFTPTRAPTRQRSFRGAPPANMGDRIIAAIIDDCCISWIVNMVWSTAFTMISCFTCGIGACCPVLWIPWGCVYMWVRDGFNEGKGIGKGMMNLRVVDYETGAPATYGQSIIRNCTRDIITCICTTCCCCLMGCPVSCLFALGNDEGRALHDNVGGTIVISEK